MEALLVKGHGQAPPVWVAGGACVFWLAEDLGRVVATRVRLIFAGWVPQDGAFGWSVSAV